MDTLTIGEAKSRLSELVSRASAGERFLIRRRSRPVAVVLSPHELERLERSASAVRRLAEALGQDPEILDRIDEGRDHPAMAAFGLWRDEEEEAELEEEMRMARERRRRRSLPEL